MRLLLRAASCAPPVVILEASLVDPTLFSRAQSKEVPNKCDDFRSVAQRPIRYARFGEEVNEKRTMNSDMKEVKASHLFPLCPLAFRL